MKNDAKKGSEMPVAETAPADPHAREENANALSAKLGGKRPKTYSDVEMFWIERIKILAKMMKHSGVQRIEIEVTPRETFKFKVFPCSETLRLFAPSAVEENTPCS